MIYISKNNQTEIATDSLVNFIPDFLDIYLNDVWIGNFENISTSVLFIRFLIPYGLTDYDEKEYNMKIYNHEALIKEELVIIHDFLQKEFKSITKTKNITFYE